MLIGKITDHHQCNTWLHDFHFIFFFHREWTCSQRSQSITKQHSGLWIKERWHLLGKNNWSKQDHMKQKVCCTGLPQLKCSKSTLPGLTSPGFHNSNMQHEKINGQHGEQVQRTNLMGPVVAVFISCCKGKWYFVSSCCTPSKCLVLCNMWYISSFVSSLVAHVWHVQVACCTLATDF